MHWWMFSPDMDIKLVLKHNNSEQDFFWLPFDFSLCPMAVMQDE